MHNLTSLRMTSGSYCDKLAPSDKITVVTASSWNPSDCGRLYTPLEIANVLRDLRMNSYVLISTSGT